MEPLPPGNFLHHWDRWPDEDGPWTIGVHLAPVDGRIELVGLEVWAVPPPERRKDLSMARALAAETVSEHPSPIRSSEFRRLTPDALTRQAIEDLTTDAQVMIQTYEWLKKRRTSGKSRGGGADVVQGGQVVHYTDAQSGEWQAREADKERRLRDQLAAGRSRGGRPVLYDDAHYVEVADVYNRAVALRQSPVQAVAKHFGYAPTQAAKHVQRARARGLDLAPPRNSGQFQPRHRR